MNKFFKIDYPFKGKEFSAKILLVKDSFDENGFKESVLFIVFILEIFFFCVFVKMFSLC